MNPISGSSTGYVGNTSATVESTLGSSGDSLVSSGSETQEEQAVSASTATATDTTAQTQVVTETQETEATNPSPTPTGPVGNIVDAFA